MPNDDAEQVPVDDQITLFDARSTTSGATEALTPGATEALTRRLESLGLRANLLAPVLELSPRTTWIDARGYLNFSSYIGLGGWDLDGETGQATYTTTQNEPLWSLEIWLTNLDPAVYLLVVEVQGYTPLGPSPKFNFGGPGTIHQTINVLPAGGRQYLGTLFAPSSSGLDLVTVQAFNLRAYGFFRATLIDVFS
jgi:hypothetical protein